MAETKTFQSTQPKRAATGVDGQMVVGVIISIHAAQEGCDFEAPKDGQIPLLFQSTQPKRAATVADVLKYQNGSHFNPRSPRGLRR